MAAPNTPPSKDQNNQKADWDRPDEDSQDMEEAQEEAAEQREDEGGYQ